MSKWRAKALELFPEMRPQIESVDSIGALWVELGAQFPRIYERNSGSNSQRDEPSALFRAIAQFAVWCTRSESQDVQEAAWIEFYEALPRFALESKETVYKKIVSDLVAVIGFTEVEKTAQLISAYVGAERAAKFLADAKLAEQTRQRRSKKK